MTLAATLFGAPAAQAEGRLVTEQIRSASFAGSRIGISPVRNLTIYLPPRYAEQGRRFPVLYFLNHFFEDHREPFASHGAKTLLDKAVAEGVIGDIIVVVADFSTPAGSSWYVNSPVTGNWEDFMVRELVPHVDATYRTLASRDSRGIAGDGVGGYGAMRFGMRHPELFGAVYAMQPVGTGPGVQTTYSRPDWKRLAEVRSFDELGEADIFSRIFTSIYQAFTPNPERPPLFFDPSARLVERRAVADARVVARLHEGMSLSGQIPDHAENLKSLRGFKFDWGRADTIVDHVVGNQAFAHRLDEFGVPHEAEEHGGGFRDRHWGEQGRFFTEMLPFFARHLLFGPPVRLQDRVVAAHGRLRDAMITHDVDARLRLYRSDAMSMPEYQPALYGLEQISAYHRAMAGRRRVIDYIPVTTEIFDLDGIALEIGTFAVTWRLANGAIEEERGKFAHVWAEEPDGSLRLRSDVWGFFRPLSDPAAFLVDMPEAVPVSSDQAPGARRLAAELDTRNRAMARAVMTRDTEAKIADYTDDAVYMPFADTNKVGIGEIRAHLVPYTRAGAGVTFDSVRVWNVGFESHGDFILEYPKFRVEWSMPGQSGVVKGGGLRLWKRMPGGVLKLHRQIGTHDHVR
ncbi:alpha/beta hydrolase-fold protein [Sphingomonas sp. DT-207]|uniref:alpha/beta hydrolase-fold protein n=1 Tax=Sphingomonas sp. DT-207 TaxID=3396167 RepID=UPI003F54180D